jgi:Glu-tRNA(Gln) amidotransferase subunit E-like FAD-binding protein
MCKYLIAKNIDKPIIKKIKEQKTQEKEEKAKHVANFFTTSKKVIQKLIEKHVKTSFNLTWSKIVIFITRILLQIYKLILHYTIERCESRFYIKKLKRGHGSSKHSNASKVACSNSLLQHSKLQTNYRKGKGEKKGSNNII